jgi:acyl-CoA thioester hydrolase
VSAREPAGARKHAFHLSVVATLRDTDGLGHVNNAVYLSWLEEVRTGYVIGRRGFRAIEEVDFVLASAHLDFRSPVYLGETVDLSCSPSRIGRTSWDLVYEGRARRDGRLVVEARSVQVQYDYGTKSTKPIPEEWRRMLEADLLPGRVE